MMLGVESWATLDASEIYAGDGEWSFGRVWCFSEVGEMLDRVDEAILLMSLKEVRAAIIRHYMIVVGLGILYNIPMHCCRQCTFGDRSLERSNDSGYVKLKPIQATWRYLGT